ncbi:MAG: PIG-L deacetylase family protein [Gaiellales bacterium]
MLALTPLRAAGRGLDVLALGAHADDIEIGCGGTLLWLTHAFGPVSVRWIVLGAADARAGEARASAAAYLEAAHQADVAVCGFQDSFFPAERVGLKEHFEKLKGDGSPDLVFTHYRDDLHQDHRLVNELTWNTFRDHAILEYEVPKYDGDLGQPNVFVPLSKEVCTRKTQLLMEHFPSQRDRHWFSEDLFHALLRIRGVECAAPTGLAEAFYGRKVVVGR